MSEPSEPVTVKILGKEYQIQCPLEERPDLFASATLLDERMRAIRHAGRVLGGERIAVMVALNLAHELLLTTKKLKMLEVNVPDRLQEITRSVEKSLTSHDSKAEDRS